MNKYITVNPNPRSQWRGIGHQFLNFLVPYILSKRYNLKFVYQPFSGENCGAWAPIKSGARCIDQPVKLWNSFLNFDQDELNLNDVKDIKQIKIPFINPQECKWDHPIFKELFEKDYEADVLFVVPDDKDGMFMHIDWDTFDDNSLRNKYHLAKLKQPLPIFYLDHRYLNIALHRRAADVTMNTPFNRWMPIDYYLKLIDNINQIKFNKPHLVHLFSYDIDSKEIEQIKNRPNICLHINENTFDTFHNMTNCDIIANGQSAFSVMACYLSHGIKLCSPWYIHYNNFPDQNDIIKVNKDSSFDCNKLLKAMENKNEKI